MSYPNLLRQLPSVDALVHGAEPHHLAVREARTLLAEARERLRRGEMVDIAGLPALLRARLANLEQPSLRRVINATGVVLHTNLGRAPLARFEPILGYSNLEYDLDTGRRGKRDAHVGPLLERLLSAPAITVNNNAAAIFLALHELAAGGEVIVSRGELVEIGDGFRIPDIMARSGAVLHEVGTTNRTHLDDYRRALNERTRLILRVHPSNFRIEGFTSKPALTELAALGREAGVPVYEDIGSGCLLDLSRFGLREPVVQDSLQAGVDLVSFSTDKLMGGPQAGVLAGRADLVARLRRNPLYRAFRVDKLILQALENTVRHLVRGEHERIPALRMLATPATVIAERVERLRAGLSGLAAEIIAGSSLMGGGSTPEQGISTTLLVLSGQRVVEWERELRLGDPAVIALLDDNRLQFDLRTIDPSEDEELLSRLQALSR